MAHMDIESVLSIGCSAAATEKIARHAGTILKGRTAELEAESAIGQSLDVGGLIALFLLAEPAGGGNVDRSTIPAGGKAEIQGW